jgi:hypothetical protein
MTDVYPPFRLDLGVEEVGDPESEPAAAVDAVVPARRGWTVGPVLALAAGSTAVLVALATGCGAAVVTVVDHGMRDDHGYLMSGSERFDSPGYAVSTEDLDVQLHHGAGSLPRRMLGRVKITADPVGGRPLFVGIGRADEVAAYLHGIEHTVVVDLVDSDGRLEPEYREVDGLAPTAAPSDAGIWVAQATGPGPLVLRWEPQGGDWAVVVMNADGSAEVSAEMTVGATVPVLGWGAAALLTVAIVSLALGIALLFLAVQLAHRRRTTTREVV